MQVALEFLMTIVWQININSKFRMQSNENVTPHLVHEYSTVSLAKPIFLIADSIVDYKLD